MGYLTVDTYRAGRVWPHGLTIITAAILCVCWTAQPWLPSRYTMQFHRVLHLSGDINGLNTLKKIALVILTKEEVIL